MSQTHLVVAYVPGDGHPVRSVGSEVSGDHHVCGEQHPAAPRSFEEFFHRCHHPSLRETGADGVSLGHQGREGHPAPDCQDVADLNHG